MDEHQRRVWGRMIDEVDEYRTGGIGLDQLVNNVLGLYQASEVRSRALGQQFLTRWGAITQEWHVRTEGWALEGTASDEHISDLLNEFKGWIQEVVAGTDQQRE